MADKKITQLDNITGANLVDADEFVVVDVSADETKAVTLGELKEAFDAGSGFVRVTGDTMTGDLSFGDNDKAIFGAGSDLEIYHDGSDSYIKDAGTGRLILIGNDQLRLENTDGDAYLAAVADGSTFLYHAGNNKLATTSTGVDLNGTLTSDGLQVTNTATSGTNQEIASFRTASGGGLVVKSSDLSSANPDSILEPFFDESLKVRTNGNDRLKVANNGDVSFYEDTGTTPKFFWDASAESLGIGTDSPSAPLQVSSTSGTIPALGAASSHAAIGSDGFGTMIGTRSTGVGYIQQQRFDGTATAYSLLLQPNGGNVGIGSLAPDTTIHGAKNGGATLTLENTDTTLAANDLIGGIDFKGNDSSEDGNEVLAYIRANAKDSTPDSYLTFGTLTNVGGVDDTVEERMRIDHNGNVGIGTETPQEHLHVSGAGTQRLEVETTQAANSAILKLTSTAGGYGLISDGFAALTFYDYGSAAERMRIDSDGNLLVGKLSASSTTVGFETKPTGFTAATRDGNTALVLNRLNSDGTIQDFRKDGATVGSIGVSGNELFLGSTGGNDAFIRMGYDTIAPASSSGLNRSDTIKLGASNNRFKDLYLSGGVYLGGTGAANKLDDYETGTFNSHIYDSDDDSVAISFTGQGDYTKIGNVLTFNAQCFGNGFPSTTFTGKPYMRLPFSIVQAAGTVASIGYYAGIGTAKQGYVLGSGSNQIRFATQLDNPYNHQLATGNTWGGNIRLYISGTVLVST